MRDAFRCEALPEKELQPLGSKIYYKMRTVVFCFMKMKYARYWPYNTACIGKLQYRETILYKGHSTELTLRLVVSTETLHIALQSALAAEADDTLALLNEPD